MTDPKTRRLSVYLIKQDVPDMRSALKEPSELRSIELEDDLPYEGVIYIAQSRERRPEWVEFLNAAVAEDISDIFNRNNSAVLLVRACERIFALVFGYGRHFLKPETIVQRFGLKTMLNIVNPQKIQSMDSRVYEDMVVSTRTQASQTTDLNAFGIEEDRDLLRKIVGQPSNLDVASRAAGARAITIHAPVTVRDVAEKCSELLEAYERDDYEDYFDWVDHVREVVDPSLISTLDNMVTQAILDRNVGKMHLAPPEIVDWTRISSFSFSGIRDSDNHVHLRLDDYRAYYDSHPDNLSVEKLKRDKVEAIGGGGDDICYRWSLYSCIVWETPYEDRLYALIEGNWYSIHPDFAADVLRYVGSIDVGNYVLPHAHEDEREDCYNERAAREREELLNLDQDLFLFGNALTSMEFCDLLSSEKRFIHVKRGHKSSKLSHHFSQGYVAAEAFAYEPDTREQLRKHVDGEGEEFCDVFPEESPDRSEYEVSYAIISKADPEEWPRRLPFFSQVNLRQRVRGLRRMGFKVTLRRIPVEEEQD